MNPNRFAYERLLMNIAGAFLLPISNALIGNTNLILACKLGLGYAVGVLIGFVQNPSKPVEIPASVNVGGQVVPAEASVRVQATTEPAESEETKP